MRSLKEFDNLPQITFSLSGLTHPIEVSHIFRDKNITGAYVYRLMYKGIVVKYGMSNTKELTPGDRVYSQVGRVKSWNVTLRRGIGNDFVDIMDDFKKMYGVDLDHNHMQVTVWDFTKYRFKAFNPNVEVRKFEAALIKRYIDAVGHKPIGNLRAEAAALNRTYVTVGHFDSMFQDDCHAE